MIPSSPSSASGHAVDFEYGILLKHLPPYSHLASRTITHPLSNHTLFESSYPGDLHSKRNASSVSLIPTPCTSTDLAEFERLEYPPIYSFQ
jgi:hypothetical protein